MKNILRLVILVSFFGFLSVSLSAKISDDGRPRQENSFKKGDRWCAIGNSITHQGRYLQMIYLYYITRFPYEQFDLFNCGAGGDTATGTLTRRMDADILINNPTTATVMLGINDIWWEHSGLFTSENYPRDLEGIVNRLKQAGSRVILITPSPYDYSVKSEEPVDPKRLGLERLAGEVVNLAKKYDLPVVDFYNQMMTITFEGQAHDSAFTLLQKDRVHTKPIADFIMGYLFLKATAPLTSVSEIIIDAKSESLSEQTNCTVEDLVVNSEEIRFSSLEKALPYPQSAIPQDALKYGDFNSEWNREILRVRGLETGQYTLYIDDVAVDNYSASELSQGVNLALSENTSQSKQAELLHRLISEYTSVMGEKIRYIRMIEYGELKKRYDIDDVSTPKSDIIKQFGADNSNFDKYLALKKEESLWIKEAENLKKLLWENNKPHIHRYLIKKTETK